MNIQFVSRADWERAKKDIPGFWHDPAQGKCIHGILLGKPCKKCYVENKNYNPKATIPGPRPRL